MYYDGNSPTLARDAVASKPTESEPDRQQPADTQANLRVELIGQLAAAQMAIEEAISALMANGANAADATELRSKLGGLIGLRQVIGTADSTSLLQLRAQVQATATAATASADNAVGSPGNSSNGQTMTANKARQAIAEVGHKLFDEKVLDPYLQFSSPEDELEYRRRERDRQMAYELEIAKGTPDSYRRAAAIEKAQLADAGAHGADRSPDFASMSNTVDSAIIALPKSQGRTEDPVRSTTGNDIIGVAPGSDSDLDGVLATLKASGVKTLVVAASGDDGHGLTSGPRRQSGSVRLPG